ncbi:hypothetical protein O181_033497 [Austropuccinia psidii MF-1]|uniref:Uncharacterized protein n=1 Tax=Austropuccinia psidii MF-1 TaxID=1389203 RepID=A0A9Q3H783_9BASI|nr:hypothetical protein [Austropuccinia psidii MF-1]
MLIAPSWSVVLIPIKWAHRPTEMHQGKSCVNRWCLLHVKQTSSRIQVELTSSERQAHVLLLSYTKSCDIHQYLFPCAFNSDSSPPNIPQPSNGW